MDTSLQYVLQPEAQRMLGHFSSLLNVRIGFFAPDGREICIGQGRPVCAYCQTLREEYGMDAQCRDLDRSMFARAHRARHAFSYPCHAGLTEAFVPVDLAGKRVGLIMVGQLRKAGQAPPASLRALGAEYRQRPVFSEAQIDDMLRMLELMVRYITDHHLVARRDFDLVQPLLDAYEEDPALALTVAQAAARCGRSPSGFAHLFKRLLGQSFSAFQTERKLAEADRLLHTFPGMPVKEVAARIGLDDPLYFSRLYRRHRGRPPSMARTNPKKKRG